MQGFPSSSSSRIMRLKAQLAAGSNTSQGHRVRLHLRSTLLRNGNASLVLVLSQDEPRGSKA